MKQFFLFLAIMPIALLAMEPNNHASLGLVEHFAIMLSAGSQYTERTLDNLKSKRLESLAEMKQKQAIPKIINQLETCAENDKLKSRVQCQVVYDWFISELRAQGYFTNVPVGGEFTQKVMEAIE